MKPAPEIRVTLVQPDLVWENKHENLARLSQLISTVDKTDLVVLPEMFSTGFSMQPEMLAEKMDGDAMEWMRQLAHNHDCVVTGSLIIQENGRFFNRLIWMRQDGTYAHYDKRHLFSFAGEEAHYSAGTSRLIVELNGWKICPLICYDLRFPVWSRNQSLFGQQEEAVYDVLIYVANWPEARRRPWTNLLEARAHENQSFVIGVNRVGIDGNGINHTGDSVIFSPKGECLSQCTPGEETVSSATLSRELLVGYREKFTAWKDKDSFEVKDPRLTQ